MTNATLPNSSAGSSEDTKLVLPDYLRTLKDYAAKDATAYAVDGRLAINHTDDSAVDDIDTARMYVPSRIISASTEDRVGDILMADGCDLENYRKNPVVYFDHGHIRGEPPIARAEDPDGAFVVTIQGGIIRGGYTFSQSLELAEQIFHLLAERILRGHSVHFNPFSIERLGPRPPQGVHWPTLFNSWEMLEFGPTGIPCNPDAVGKMLSDRRLLGKSLHPSLFKSLSKFAPEPAFHGVGWTPPPKLESKTNGPTDSVHDRLRRILYG